MNLEQIKKEIMNSSFTFDELGKLNSFVISMLKNKHSYESAMAINDFSKGDKVMVKVDKVVGGKKFIDKIGVIDKINKKTVVVSFNPNGLGKMYRISANCLYKV